MKCKVCGVVETETPDMCEYCFKSINALETLQRYFYSFEDVSEGASWAQLLEDMASVKRDSITKKVESIAVYKGPNGERIPCLMHAPLLSRTTDRYAHIGGLLQYMLNLSQAVKLQEHEEYLKYVILSSLHHADKRYQYLDPNSDKPFKLLPSRPGYEISVVYRAVHAGIKLTQDELIFITNRDMVRGVGVHVIANEIVLLRGS